MSAATALTATPRAPQPPKPPNPTGATTAARASTSAPPAAPRAAIRLFNPIAMRLAGTRLLPLWGVIEHRGRRTGKTFRTPVVVRRTEDGFIVPLPWGDRTDWYRNVRAAGHCVIRWKGRDYPMAQPELLSNPTDAMAFFSPVQRALMPLFGIRIALRL